MAAAAQREQHAHVRPADPAETLAHFVEGLFDERAQTHEVDREQEVRQIEIAAFALPLQGDELDVAAAGTIGLPGGFPRSRWCLLAGSGTRGLLGGGSAHLVDFLAIHAISADCSGWAAHR